MKLVYTDRSRIEQYQRCPRSRFLAYHQGGMGIAPARTPLPLAVGGAVHAGIAALLIDSMRAPSSPSLEHENAAVQVALREFQERSSTGGLDLDAVEQAEMMTPRTSLHERLGQSLEMPDAELQRIAVEHAARAREGFDLYLWKEQCALVEALVRAYARRRLGPLLGEFEVLEVEQEGEWLLASDENDLGESESELWFMSRPDALLRHRQSNDLYLLSLKTAASWDVRKAKDAEHDMQGLSEGVEVEKRLREWWREARNPNSTVLVSPALASFLRECPAPPRILAVRYEYILKGERREDKDLSARYELPVRAQRSHLIRGYLNAGMTAGDEQWNWSWDYHKEDGAASKLYWKAWRPAPVWEAMPIARWIDMLAESTETFVEEGRLAGYTSKAQATGFTARHPLDEVFVPPIVVYRNDDDLRDWLEQAEAQETRVAQAVASVQEVAGDEGERRHRLNVLFPQTRKACEYPSSCPFVPVCYGGEDIRRDPLGAAGGGQLLYKVRTPNHPQEAGAEAAEAAEAQIKL